MLAHLGSVHVPPVYRGQSLGPSRFLSEDRRSNHLHHGVTLRIWARHTRLSPLAQRQIVRRESRQAMQGVMSPRVQEVADQLHCEVVKLLKFPGLLQQGTRPQRRRNAARLWITFASAVSTRVTEAPASTLTPRAADARVCELGLFHVAQEAKLVYGHGAGPLARLLLDATKLPDDEQERATLDILGVRPVQVINVTARGCNANLKQNTMVRWPMVPPTTKQGERQDCTETRSDVYKQLPQHSDVSCHTCSTDSHAKNSTLENCLTCSKPHQDLARTTHCYNAARLTRCRHQYFGQE